MDNLPESYRRQLDQRYEKYVITREQEQQDGSILILIKKQDNGVPTWDYLKA